MHPVLPLLSDGAIEMEEWSPRPKERAEAFKKTFKRDNVYIHGRPDCQTMRSQLPRRFGNSKRALEMLSRSNRRESISDDRIVAQINT